MRIFGGSVVKMRRARHQPENGFSLVELLIAMAIGLVVMGGLFAIYIGSAQGGRQSDSVTRMGEDATVALETLARYIVMAGYSWPVRFQPRNAVLFDGQIVQPPDSNFAGAGVRGCDGGFTSGSDKGAWENLACANGNGSDAISVRYEGDIYNTEPVANALGVLLPTDCLSQGVETNADSAVDATVKYTLIEARLFINQNSELSCAGNAKNSSGAVTFAPQPLVSGVEKMQLRYGIANDSTANQVAFFGNAATVDALGGSKDQNWGRVIVVRVCLQMVSPIADQLQPVPYTDCDGVRQTPRDNFLRRTFTTTVSLRNRIGVA